MQTKFSYGSVIFFLLFVLLAVASFGVYSSQEQIQERKKAFLIQSAKSYLAGDLPAAIKAKQEVVRLEPSDMLAQYDLAKTLKKAGRITEAVEILRKVAVSNDTVFAKAAQKELKDLTGK